MPSTTHTFTVESVEMTDNLENPFVAKVKYWPGEKDTDKKFPMEWGFGKSHAEAIASAMEDMISRLAIDATPLKHCTRCNRPIEVDRLKGKPADHTGYCLGFHTCLQAPPVVQKVKS